jgi:hypothetical protein
MHLGADAVHAEDLAGHLEAGDLVAAVLEQDVGLEEAGAHGIEGLERFAGAIEVLLALELAAGADQAVELGQLFLAQPLGEAQFMQTALGTGRLDGDQADGNDGLVGQFRLAFSLCRLSL